MSSPPVTRNGEQPLHCMICRSSDLGVIDYPLPVRLIRSLVLMVLPIPREWLERRTVRCGVCGHQWQLTTQEWLLATRPPRRPD